MAKVKYSEDVQPLLNQHFGFTFQPNINGQSLFPASRSKRFRRPRQHHQQHNNQKAVTQWRNMAPEIQTAWNNFAAAYQQPAKRNPAIFLSGYQIFIKRNSYCFLNHGIESEFMTAPEMEMKTYEETLFVLEAGDNVIDLTELYISNFGLLPAPGQWVLFCALPYSDTSGQFFPPILETLEVKSVYMDGFFLNLTLPPESSDIVYSVYISKPVSAGKTYAGTKIRYMGCFTSKKFTALTDVPVPTPADTGKVWGVAPDGTWSLIPQSGGGGLTCEDLPACHTIIAILESLVDLQNQITDISYVSSPPVKFGLLYKYSVCTDVRNIAPAGWEVPAYADYLSLIALFGGAGLAGGKLKDTDGLYWTAPNTGATNIAETNIKGCGQCNFLDGSFSYNKSRFYFWLLGYWLPTSSRAIMLTYSNDDTAIQVASNGFGFSLLLIKRNSGVADGVKTTMRGNDGRLYRAVSLGNIFWLADPLAETRWRTGELIFEATQASEWANIYDPMLCAFNYNWTNV